MRKRTCLANGTWSDVDSTACHVYAGDTCTITSQCLFGLQCTNGACACSGGLTVR